MTLTNNRHDGLSSLPAGPGGEPFEERGLGQRTDFQSRAPRAGADFKAMAIDRLRGAGTTIERLDFEVNRFPVDAQMSGPNGRQFLVLARGTPEEQDRGALRRTRRPLCSVTRTTPRIEIS